MVNLLQGTNEALEGEKEREGAQHTITNMKFSNTDTKWPYPGIAMAQ